jgi:hypothetical protein
MDGPERGAAAAVRCPDAHRAGSGPSSALTWTVSAGKSGSVACVAAKIVPGRGPIAVGLPGLPAPAGVRPGWPCAMDAGCGRHGVAGLFRGGGIVIVNGCGKLT